MKNKFKALKPRISEREKLVILPDTGERYLSTILYDFVGYPL